jgi:uncharacterized protein (TIGR03086 family)
MLVRAVRYTLSAARLATPLRMSLPTPCADWDLRALLGHVGDSMEVLAAALSTGVVGAGLAPAAGNRDRLSPVANLSLRATTLLCACAVAGSVEKRVAIGDRELTTSLVVLAGAVEIAVHGWDISIACGATEPIPSGLASDLLPIAVLLTPPGARAGLFADPVHVSEQACPGDLLVAFLGRHPGRAAAPGSG